MNWPLLWITILFFVVGVAAVAVGNLISFAIGWGTIKGYIRRIEKCGGSSESLQ
jgi:hypothetical protein